MFEFVLQMQQHWHAVLLFLCVVWLQLTWTVHCVRACSQLVLSGQPNALLYVLCIRFRHSVISIFR